MRRCAAVGGWHGVGLCRRDGGDEVDAVSSWFGGRGGAQGVDILGGSERARDCAGRADQPRQPACVDTADPGDAVSAQHRVEVGLRPTVGVAAGDVTDDDTAAEQPPRLEVGGVDPVVADVRVGERHDLPGVAGIGEHLLIAAEGGVEHDFSCGRRRVGTEQFALEQRSVLEDENPRTHVHAL